MKKFAVFDLDGTLIRWQLYHALADALASNGNIDSNSYQAMRNARSLWKRRSGSSFKDYEAQVIIIYETMLKTLSFNQLDEAIELVFDEYKDQVYTYTRDLIINLKNLNYLLFAISGSQTEIVAKIAEYYGFDDFTATLYTRSGEQFTGQKTTAIAHKDKVLQDMVAKFRATFHGSLGIGDSRSDASMLRLVEQPIAFNPDRDLYEIAKTKGWKIILERKNMIYELESKDGKYQLVKTNA